MKLRSPSAASLDQRCHRLLLTIPRVSFQIGDQCISFCDTLDHRYDCYGPTSSLVHNCLLYGRIFPSNARKSHLPATRTLPETRLLYQSFPKHSAYPSLLQGLKVSSGWGADVFDPSARGGNFVTAPHKLDHDREQVRGSSFSAWCTSFHPTSLR